MRTHRIVAGALVCLAALSRPVLAQEPSALLVEVDWLSQHLNDRGLVVLQVGDKSAYEAGHIPGARFITEEDVAAPHDHNNPKYLMLELLSGLPGLKEAADIVHCHHERYDGTGYPRGLRALDIPLGARMFTLDYLGLGSGRLLNAAWAPGSAGKA